jgi:hypothetical protein
LGERKLKGIIGYENKQAKNHPFRGQWNGRGGGVERVLE